MQTVNDLIRELQQISPSKRELPIVITCPNGLQVYPAIKMQTKDPRFFPAEDNPVEKMVLTWG